MTDAPATTILAFIQWTLSEARFIDTPVNAMAAMVAKLHDIGIPVSRVTTAIPNLHPQVDAVSTQWEQGKEIIQRRYRRADDDDDSVKRSLLWPAYREGRSSRVRLETGPVPDEYILLTELREAGHTDYLVLPLPFGDGSHKAMTFATHRPGGFSDAEIAFFFGVQNALTVLVERLYLNITMDTLMNTYVGRVAGRHVLNGEIKRGDGHSISAALWFSDLKGFTVLSQRLSTQEIIDLLNHYFDAILPGIIDNGGEVLKYIGDAVLAVFQPGEGGNAEAVQRAKRASEAAIQSLADMNATRGAPSLPKIECGIGLHFGDVHYGNVGGLDRLDFTVIGPAVNLASRIEGLTRETGHPMLVSAEFAALHGGGFHEAGRFSLKGIDEPVMIFAPD